MTAWIRAALDAISRPKTLAIFCLACLLWFSPLIHRHIPVDGATKQVADLIALAVGLLAFAGVLIHGSVAAWNSLRSWFKSPKRRLRNGIKRTDSIEKLLLRSAIAAELFNLQFDIGSPIAMHLEQLGIIELDLFSDSGYKLPIAVRTLCVKEPDLLAVSTQGEESACQQIDEWRKAGKERRLLDALEQRLSNRRSPYDWRR
jgi:hypothetical protein